MTDIHYEPARDYSGNAIYLDEDGKIVDLPSFIAPPRRWRPLFVQPRGEPGEPPTFFERRAAADPSVDHSSHSTAWVGPCRECPPQAEEPTIQYFGVGWD